MKRRPVIHVDAAVVGAGVAGLATALHLSRSKKFKVLVIEREKALGGHASGRNAGMIRQAVSDPFIARLAAESRRVFTAASRSWKFSLRPNGSMLLAREADAEALVSIRRAASKPGIRTLFLSPAEALRRVPALEGVDFDRTLFCPGDALVDTEALLAGFQAALRRNGAGLWLGASPLALTRADGLFRITFADREVFTPKIVNAAGAWCADLALKMGAQKIPLVPYRRHLFVSRPVRWDQRGWPFVWDLTREFYFRPEGRALLFSPCDKEPAGSKELGARREPVFGRARTLALKKMRDYPALSGMGIARAKSGLRTMTPDGRFVIGEDARLEGFYWVAGLGGHGVTTCFAVGRLAGDIIMGRKTDPSLARAFAPARFA